MAKRDPSITKKIKELLRDHEQAAARDDREALRRVSQEIADRCLAIGTEDLTTIARRVNSERADDTSS